MNTVETASFLQRKQLLQEKDLLKLLAAIDIHQYRGASKKRHNGVVPIRPTDAHLWQEYASGCGQQPGLPPGVPVKVVAHVPSGVRLVGRLCGGNTLYLLGVASYTRRL